MAGWKITWAGPVVVVPGSWAWFQTVTAASAGQSELVWSAK
ncbi:hypothetical protein [Actinocrispum sp. NPDC049592]